MDGSSTVQEAEEGIKSLLFVLKAYRCPQTHTKNTNPAETPSPFFFIPPPHLETRLSEVLWRST